MRVKGRVIKWNCEKAFGFIAPNGGGSHVFIHKTALQSRSRIPKINDVITFAITKDKAGRLCACNATFLGEKLKIKAAKKTNKFSIYLAVLFLSAISCAFFIGRLPQNLMYAYFGLSVVTFIVYAFDKSKAQRNTWRTQESTLHFLALAGGWPGAAIAQQLLRHKSAKQEFRAAFWGTVVVNLAILVWLHSVPGSTYLALFA